jgi:hypothetical protein
VSKVNFLCSQPHYLDHMLPVYLALPSKYRGDLYVGSALPDPDALTVVSSWGDHQLTSGPTIFFEHGAGFSYQTTKPHPSYAGGPGRERVVLFCNVNEYAHNRNVAAYPDIPSVVVGSPKLDAMINRPAPTNNKPKVAFSFHWDCRVAPETRSALEHYRHYFNRSSLNSPKLEYLGHGHPLAWPGLRKVWERSGVKQVQHFNDVATMADVYVCDTSSTIYEFAALNRPVVVLNAPWYRKDVNHGLRFWDNVPGIQVEHHTSLGEAIRQACFEDVWQAERERITGIVYPHLGKSSKKAAEAIVQLLA